MRFVIPVTTAVLLFGAAQASAAVPPAQPPQQPQQPQQQQPAMPAPQMEQMDVSDSQLETFADIYVDMQALEQDLAQSVAEAENTEDAQAVHARAEEKMIGVIEDHGWSVDEYNAVAQAINNSPELRMQAVALINERS